MKMPAKTAVTRAEKTFASFKPVSLYIDPISRELQEDLGLEIVTMSLVNPGNNFIGAIPPR